MQAPLAGVGVVEMGGAAVGYAGKLLADRAVYPERSRSSFDSTALRSGRTEERRSRSAQYERVKRDPLRPLAGLRVVDLGWVWAGALPGHILADMGAEVIKIESASPLDYMRQGRPIVGTQKDPEQIRCFIT